MTTGSTSTGSRYRTILGYNAGTWTEKTWSGSDRPKGISPSDPRYLAPHDYTAHITEKSIPEVEVLVDRNYPYKPSRVEVIQGNTVASLHGNPVFPSDPWTDNDWLALVAKLRNQVNDGRTNLGVTIAEMGETIDSIGKIARRVAKLTMDAAVRSADMAEKVTSRRKLAKMAKAFGRKALRDQLRRGPFKRAASGWLEYRLAVYPALMDIGNHCESLANLHNKKTSTRFTAGRTSRNVRKSRREPPAAWGDATMAHKAYIRAILKSEPNRWLSYTGLADPATILWERIPLSFVVDWMLPVGDFLAAVDFWRRNEGTFVVTHVLEKTCFSWSPVPPPGGDTNQVWTSAGGYSYRDLKMERKVNTELQIPYPSLNLTIGKSATSLRRTLDAVSLFVIPGLKGRY